MNIVIPVTLIPDLVEELTIDETGTALDLMWASLILNEFDNHAIEQGLLLKERFGGQVTVVAPDIEGADDVLFTAAARGAHRFIKLVGEFGSGANSHVLARAFTSTVEELNPDLVLIGVQAHNDLDGQVGPLLAEYLGFPYVGYIAGVAIGDGKATVQKEYPGGFVAEMEVVLPAVLGIQASEEPPGYVAFSKVRQAMKTATIEKRTVEVLDRSGAPAVTRMFQPEVGQRATMLEGEVEDIAAQLLEILDSAGVL